MTTELQRQAMLLNIEDTMLSFGLQVRGMRRNGDPADTAQTVAMMQLRINKLFDTFLDSDEDDDDDLLEVVHGQK